ncbi:Diguanylate cyclase [Bosea sp. LC85]|uniref:GGDEF domain-containing protein n=1 Tax=Bosea sp. LC85 TaxID=1502851 RepID=UPI0004E43AC6|nr:GGDEF domain-containing protein [Bosea sp. LC85]KFC66066.1 Diguanylate cyclase [Bosea sp. LC85]
MRALSNPLVLIGPAILLVFAASFASVWIWDRRHRHLLFFCAACLLFCLGTLSQILGMPDGHGPNAVTSAVLYTLSVLLLNDGLLRRSGQGLSWASYGVILLLITGGIAYFYYVDRQLIVRIYILNFGYGLICLATIWRLRRLRIGRVAEQILFWSLLAFSLHFFLRTVLTVGTVAPPVRDFGSSPFWLALQFSLAILGVALALALFALTISDTVEDLRHERSADSLTGLLNRRGFDERAQKLLDDARTWPTSLILVDIDHFKSINDTFGHPAGDAVLKSFGNLLQGAMRQVDVCGRLGGEEFAFLLPNCDAAGAHVFAHRLREAVRQARFDGLPHSRQITASFGVASARHGESLSELIARADKVLYRAKREGRDRVEVHLEGHVPQNPLSSTITADNHED